MKEPIVTAFTLIGAGIGMLAGHLLAGVLLGLGAGMLCACIVCAENPFLEIDKEAERKRNKKD